jgi:hypothetical protein
MLSGEKITDAARNAAESLFLNNKNLWIKLSRIIWWIMKKLLKN